MQCLPSTSSAEPEFLPKEREVIDTGPSQVELSTEISKLQEMLAQKEDSLNLKGFELKEKELAIKQLKNQMFDKECRIREFNSQFAQMQSQLEEKNRELKKTEEMFKEYGAWRSKLETIETKMREEAEHWKGAAEKLQRENTKL